MRIFTLAAGLAVALGATTSVAAQPERTDENGCVILKRSDIDRDPDLAEKFGSGAMSSSVTAGNGMVSGSTMTGGSGMSSSVTAGNGQVTTSNTVNGRTTTSTTPGAGATASATSTSSDGTRTVVSSSGEGCTVIMEKE